jgi:spore maturation protein CgeB
VEDFIARGHRCFHINHAFDPRILERTERAAGAQTDFTFIGSIAKRSGFHLDREDLLLKLLERTPLEIWADTNRSTWLERSGVVIRQWAYDAIRAARSAGVPDAVLAATPGAKVMRWRERPALPSPINPRLARVARPPVFGLEMFVQLRHSRVTLNAHIDLSNRYASNMRLYEATGVGSCLLTDWRSNLPELFELNGEVVAYKSADECVEKVTYLLDHETERRSIAHAGQQRTLRCHTFDQRAAQLHDVIRHALMSK